MAVIDFPAGEGFGVRSLRFSASTPKSAWTGFFTGQSQSISHLADRLRAVVTFPPCNPQNGALREAFFMEMASAGHWVRLSHWRQVPFGTLRGTPTAPSGAAAGARTITVQGVAGDTLLGGDVLGCGNQLLQVGYQGAVANGSGVLSVPLVIPVRATITNGSAVSWQSPTGTFQLATDLLEFVIGRGGWQAALEVPFAEAI